MPCPPWQVTQVGALRLAPGNGFGVGSLEIIRLSGRVAAGVTRRCPQLLGMRQIHRVGVALHAGELGVNTELELVTRDEQSGARHRLGRRSRARNNHHRTLIRCEFRHPRLAVTSQAAAIGDFVR